MTKAPSKAYCTNVEWVGRAHCGNCHIRRLMLFSEIPPSGFDHLLQPIDHFIYPAGTSLYEAGSQKQFIYSIRRGVVKLVHATEDGNSRIVRLLGPGAAVGLELLDGADSYHHTAIAINQVDLCRIPVTTTKLLQSEFPTLCQHISQQLQDQLDLADQWIVSLGTGTAKQRVAQLIMVFDEFYTDENGAFILLNREDMAAMIGVAVETVSRVIAEFKRQKIIQKADNHLYTCDVSMLQEIIQQD